jgi:hypothetical protein
MIKLIVGILVLALCWYFFKQLRAQMKGERKVSKVREELIDAKSESQVLDVTEEVVEIRENNAKRKSALNERTTNTEEK